MNAPQEAFHKTVDYIRICGGGMLVIVAYNLIGCIFRGLGDSKTPLITVFVACIFNIAGDLVLCAVFDMGTEGAAIATVFAQVVSAICYGRWHLIRVELAKWKGMCYNEDNSQMRKVDCRAVSF